MLGRAVDEAKRAAARNHRRESPTCDDDLSSSLQDFSENDIIGYPEGTVGGDDGQKRDSKIQSQVNSSQNL